MTATRGQPGVIMLRTFRFVRRDEALIDGERFEDDATVIRRERKRWRRVGRRVRKGLLRAGTFTVTSIGDAGTPWVLERE